jgi:hypothetical protein
MVDRRGLIESLLRAGPTPLAATSISVPSRPAGGAVQALATTHNRRHPVRDAARESPTRGFALDCPYSSCTCPSVHRRGRYSASAVRINQCWPHCPTARQRETTYAGTHLPDVGRDQRLTRPRSLAVPPRSPRSLNQPDTRPEIASCASLGRRSRSRSCLDFPIRRAIKRTSGASPMRHQGIPSYLSGHPGAAHPSSHQPDDTLWGTPASLCSDRRRTSQRSNVSRARRELTSGCFWLPGRLLQG